jgi:hypothetical protein
MKKLTGGIENKNLFFDLVPFHRAEKIKKLAWHMKTKYFFLEGPLSDRKIKQKVRCCVGTILNVKPTDIFLYQSIKLSGQYLNLFVDCIISETFNHVD